MVAVTRHVGLLLHANKEWLRLFYNQFWINPRMAAWEDKADE
jgi:hypothetical protein